MTARECTGRWHLKKRFFGGYTVIVEVIKHSFNNNDGTLDPDVVVWEKATDSDLYNLDIMGIKKVNI